SDHRSHICRNTRNRAFKVKSIGPGISCFGTQRAGRTCVHPPRNKVVATQATTNMLAYSASMKKAKRIPEYSVWYPATSSDSASGMSKGVRFTSAREHV